MHSSPLSWLRVFFVPSLVRSYLLNKSGGLKNSECKNDPPAVASMFSRALVVSP